MSNFTDRISCFVVTSYLSVTWWYSRVGVQWPRRWRHPVIHISSPTNQIRVKYSFGVYFAENHSPMMCIMENSHNGAIMEPVFERFMKWDIFAAQEDSRWGYLSWFYYLSSVSAIRSPHTPHPPPTFSLLPRFFATNLSSSEWFYRWYWW